MEVKNDQYMTKRDRKVFKELFSLVSDKVLAEESMSKATQEKILTPMQTMTMRNRVKRAKKLIRIMKKSKSEDEILQRALKLDN